MSDAGTVHPTRTRSGVNMAAHGTRVATPIKSNANAASSPYEAAAWVSAARAAVLFIGMSVAGVTAGWSLVAALVRMAATLFDMVCMTDAKHLWAFGVAAAWFVGVEPLPSLRAALIANARCAQWGFIKRGLPWMVRALLPCVPTAYRPSVQQFTDFPATMDTAVAGLTKMASDKVNTLVATVPDWCVNVTASTVAASCKRGQALVTAWNSIMVHAVGRFVPRGWLMPPPADLSDVVEVAVGGCLGGMAEFFLGARDYYHYWTKERAVVRGMPAARTTPARAAGTRAVHAFLNSSFDDNMAVAPAAAACAPAPLEGATTAATTQPTRGATLSTPVSAAPAAAAAPAATASPVLDVHIGPLRSSASATGGTGGGGGGGARRRQRHG